MSEIETVKQKAIRLRGEGYSLPAIVEVIRLPKSTIYGWIRHLPIEVTVPSKASSGYRKKVGLMRQLTNAKIREGWREEGRRRARLNDKLHLMGCMLYWAEGTKDQATVGFANSDMPMQRLFLRFLTNAMEVDRSKIKARIYCYDDVHPFSKILAHWCEGLNLESDQFYRPIINPYPQIASLPSRNKRLGKLPYGTLHLRVHDVRLIHHIYGALEIYGNVFYHSQSQKLALVNAFSELS